MNSLFIALQHILPQHAVSRCMGWLAELSHPIWLKNRVIGWFVAHYGVDMSEAAESSPAAYANFNHFFTRPPMAPSARSVRSRRDE